MSPDWETPNPDVQGDLKIQLERNMQHIITRYSAYIRCIRESLEAKCVSAEDLINYLLTASAFSHTYQQIMPLLTHESDLIKATNMYKIFNFLAKEYASFLNYDIFRFIMNVYSIIDNGQEEFMYPEHLRSYLLRHKLSEFVSIKLAKWAASEKLILLMDIEVTSRLTMIADLKPRIARILGISLGSLELMDIAM